MYTGYFDEAAKEANHGPAFVLGGWVASDETWTSFTTAWNAVLAKYGVASFHHSDVMALATPYDVLSAESRAAMLDDLIGVIETHDIDGYFVHLHHQSFRNIFKNITLTKEQGRRLLNKPFYTCFHALAQAVMQDRNERGLPGPVNLVFDGEDREVAESIEILDQEIRPDLSSAQKAMLGTIVTSTDAVSVGLQAADLLVSRQNWDFKAQAKGDVMKRLCRARRIAESGVGPGEMRPCTVQKELVDRFPHLKKT